MTVTQVPFPGNLPAADELRVMMSVLLFGGGTWLLLTGIAIFPGLFLMGTGLAIGLFRAATGTVTRSRRPTGAHGVMLMLFSLNVLVLGNRLAAFMGVPLADGAIPQAAAHRNSSFLAIVTGCLSLALFGLGFRLVISAYRRRSEQLTNEPERTEDFI